MTVVSAPFRWLRSGAIGVTVLSLAAGAHTLAGGSLPAPLILAALTALTGLASVTATGFRIPLPLMATLLGASQLLLHGAFDLLSAPGMAGFPDPAMHHHLVSSAAGPVPVAAAMPAMAAGPAAPTAALTLTLAMTLAHIGATLACAVVLAKGEDALWLLAGWLRPLVRPAARSGAAVAPLVRVLTPEVPVRPQPRRNLRADSRRGPPAAAVPLT
ncbi:hypothetical protein [Paenarthrobacter sp. PH39-S1]|uniref:hypothetical protein n=1 Tax=Paenarthrobacter sp. PH39-S1 TaxID=3046204 RepID=UPI0024B96891|nr:hypothetical protein [Paenarthrobacter sp. PH39-S1]MDJ0354830.1 hypothetical protein [Paenarthrobacter sp. PH39-S1]